MRTVVSYAVEVVPVPASESGRPNGKDCYRPILVLKLDNGETVPVFFKMSQAHYEARNDAQFILGMIILNEE